MSGTRTTTERSLRQALREGTSIHDLLLVLSVPTVLLAMMTVPRAVRESLAFEYTDPSVMTAVASSFVHLSGTHLAVNLVGYGLVVGVTYALSVFGGRNRRFSITFLTLVAVCPVLLPYLNMTIVRESASVGFSGVVMALYGYLPVAFGTYLEEQFDLGSSRTTAPLLFFVSLSLITVLTLVAILANPVIVPVRGVPVPVTSVLAGTLASLTGALVLIVTLYVVSIRETWTETRVKLRDAIDRRGYVELAVVAAGVWIAVPFATFPIDPVADNSVLNLYAHLVGYALGFTATYTSMAFEQWLFDRSTA